MAVLAAVRGLLTLVNVGVERGLYAPRTARVVTLGAAVVVGAWALAAGGAWALAAGGAWALAAGDPDLDVTVVGLAALVLLVDAYGDGRSPTGTGGRASGAARSGQRRGTASPRRRPIPGV